MYACVCLFLCEAVYVCILCAHVCVHVCLYVYVYVCYEHSEWAVRENEGRGSACPLYLMPYYLSTTSAAEASGVVSLLALLS